VASGGLNFTVAYWEPPTEWTVIFTSQLSFFPNEGGLATFKGLLYTLIPDHTDFEGVVCEEITRDVIAWNGTCWTNGPPVVTSPSGLIASDKFGLLCIFAGNGALVSCFNSTLDLLYEAALDFQPCNLLC
jgi:hypothetical protein